MEGVWCCCELVGVVGWVDPSTLGRPSSVHTHHLSTRTPPNKDNTHTHIYTHSYYSICAIYLVKRAGEDVDHVRVADGALGERGVVLDGRLEMRGRALLQVRMRAWLRGVCGCGLGG